MADKAKVFEYVKSSLKACARPIHDKYRNSDLGWMSGHVDSDDSKLCRSPSVAWRCHDQAVSEMVWCLYELQYILANRRAWRQMVPLTIDLVRAFVTSTKRMPSRGPGHVLPDRRHCEHSGLLSSHWKEDKQESKDRCKEDRKLTLIFRWRQILQPRLLPTCRPIARSGLQSRRKRNSLSKIVH